MAASRPNASASRRRPPAAAPAPGSPPIDELPRLLTGVQGVPSPQLDPFLDAASRCFARFGIRRTSVQDVARELGVDRTTVYRQVGTVPQMVRLLAARDMHRIVSSLPDRVPVPFGPESLVESMVMVIDEARAHPVLSKVLHDDPDSITLSSLAELTPVLARTATTLGPMLGLVMTSGAIARRDPDVLAEWLVRLVVTLVLVPPIGDLRRFLSEILLPALDPATSSLTTD